MINLKGWIVLHALAYESQSEIEIAKLMNKEPDTVFVKTLVQISNISSIDLEYSDGFLEEGSNAFVSLPDKIMEVRETPEEIIRLIQKNNLL